MEIHLDRRLSEKRIFPAIDLARSGTRKEELLLNQSELEAVWAIRKILSVGDTAEQTENLYTRLVKSANNKEFIDLVRGEMNAIKKEGFVFMSSKN